MATKGVLNPMGQPMEPSMNFEYEGRSIASPQPPKRQQQLKARSRLATPMLLVLLPTFCAVLLAYPFLAVGSLVPVVGFFALPTLLSATVFLFYSSSWLLYLALAQKNPPTDYTLSRYLPFLPYSPYRVFKVTLTTLAVLRDLISSSAIALFFDLQFRRVLILGGKDSHLIVKKNILYAEGGRKLDVYFPVRDAAAPDGALAHVILFVGGGNWTWWNRKAGAQLALRFRRLGYVVVVPDLRQWPEVKTSGMVEDLRLALEWTGVHIKNYHGDSAEIHILGYGSGAHISALTVIQDAVVLSRNEHYARTTPVEPQGHELEPRLDVSHGIRQCQIWGPRARLPRIAGIILIAGVFDVVKQLRVEHEKGIDEISALRRACGPSSQAILQSCPSHLLFGSKQLLDPARLPPKWMLIAGGKDEQVHYTQSVLMSVLLYGVGMDEVSLKLYKEETHVGCLGSLMHETRYSPLFINEIEDFIEYLPEAEIQLRKREAEGGGRRGRGRTSFGRA